MDMLLRVEKLHKYYGGVHALDDVSFALESGMVLAIAGDNGAGKSTLMKCITGSECPEDGDIFFDGEKLSSGDPHASRAVGIEMIYQHLDLCSGQNVVANIFLGCEPHRKMFGISTPWLDLAGMKHQAEDLIGRLNSEINSDKKAGELSGGQQQAVAIARALLGRPKLLIMDEPTAALGVKETAKVLDLIRSLKNQGLAIILISHRLADIFDVADRVILMRHGRIVRNTSIEEITLPELTEEILCR